jgi:hypothetical protein
VTLGRMQLGGVATYEGRVGGLGRPVVRLLIYTGCAGSSALWLSLLRQPDNAPTATV